ncbi:MAG: Mfa1 family fimbria major subunit, partial [Tannerellaceae bacterium]|nr:Mfa1 family fimbria major subunit [Tannerellaceae bacterium]
FYTKDPNFIPGTVGEGLDFVTVNTTTYEPELRLPFDDWLDDSDTGYTIENTMDAAEQKYGNATRIVIKGIYYPDAGWSGDWFSFAGVNYETFALLKAAYTAAGTGSDLIAACDDMFNKIKTYKPSITASDFSGLQAVDLTGISNGGEIIKTDKNTACIRWYQDGLNYYYYENRHDDDTLGEMAFGKYGVVRNNWYKLKITHVSGPGTPWYPDINEPGPGDPDPVDPIDPYSGYIGIEIDVQPWIVWERGIGI